MLQVFGVHGKSCITLGNLFDSLRHSAAPLDVGGEAESRACWRRGVWADEEDEEDDSGCGWQGKWRLDGCVAG